MLKKQAKAIVISSVSGGGKTSLIQMVIKKYPEIKVAITATSRAPREGEVKGVDYFFYEREEFLAKIEENEFLEHANVHGNFYGVPRGPLFDSLDRGESVILNIDVQGKKSARDILKDRMFSIFIKPPSEEIWEERLRARDTDSEESIQRRLADGRYELGLAGRYNYRVINDDMHKAVDDICDILRKEGVLSS